MTNLILTCTKIIGPSETNMLLPRIKQPTPMLIETLVQRLLTKPETKLKIEDQIGNWVLKRLHILPKPKDSIIVEKCF